MPHYQRNIRFILFLILPILSFLLGWSLNQKSNDHTSSVTIKVEEEPSDKNLLKTLGVKPYVYGKIKPDDIDLDIFWETWNALEANYLKTGKFKTQEQIYGATKGLVNSLEDPYTVFMTPEENEQFATSIDGEFEGIGAEITIRDQQLMVVSPLKGSPAELAGLKPKDKIFKIDGEPSFGLSIEEAVLKIRGPKGEKVVLTIIREGEKKPLDITIVRDHIVIEAIEWEMQDDVAVIEVAQFGTNLMAEFEEAATQILLENPRGMIIDLRNNGGGLLDVCVDLMGEFLEEQIAVKTSGRGFGNTGDLMTGKGGSFLNIPLVVLINEGSASASEIFAGAIQDYDRGVILGAKSFGKGSVQNVLPLSDGSSLKVTIAEWNTPDGKSIHEEGIMPDEEVENDDDEENGDEVLKRALDLVGTDEMTDILKAKVAPEPEEAQEVMPETVEEAGETEAVEENQNQ